MRVIAKSTEHMAADATDIWIIRGKTYDLVRVDEPKPDLYHFIDEQGDDHFIKIDDFDQYFTHVEEITKEEIKDIYVLKERIASLENQNEVLAETVDMLSSLIMECYELRKLNKKLAERLVEKLKGEM